MLKIWGRVNSINVQKVLWTALELGLPFERIDAGGAFGLTDTPDYLRMNPNRTVPTIDEDGFVLWESNAIVRYLAARHGAGQLWPDDLRQRADVDRWMDWQTTEFSAVMRNAFLELVRKPEAQRDAARIATSIQLSNQRARILEDALAGRHWLAGDAFTLADIAVGCAAHRWLLLPVSAPLERPDTPNINTWMARLRLRQAALAVLPQVLS